MELRDDYDHVDEHIEYILENVLYDGNSTDDLEYDELKSSFNSILLNQCDCNNEQGDCSNCKHGGNYVKDISTKELILNPQRIKDLMFECNVLCSCHPQKCCNRLVQYGPRKFLRIIQSQRFKSKGLITTYNIPQGAFICEYAGELLTVYEAKRRQQINELEGNMNYVLRLNELNSHQASNQSIITIVDPSRKGNIGRYINHSCEPNCQTISVRLDNPIPKIGELPIFAKKFIKAGEELTFHYNEGVLNAASLTTAKFNSASSNRKICLCGTATCSMYLPNYDYFSPLQ